MIELTRMTETDYDLFMEISKKVFMDDQVKAGHWRAEEAEGAMQQLSNEILPEGDTTPDHMFYSIRADGEIVGGLWLMLERDGGNLIWFVVDIEIYPDYHRRGYAEQAFLVMEENARQAGIRAITLHVFEHNLAARALYEKLGYSGEGTDLLKRL